MLEHMYEQLVYGKSVVIPTKAAKVKEWEKNMKKKKKP